MFQLHLSYIVSKQVLLLHNPDLDISIFTKPIFKVYDQNFHLANGLNDRQIYIQVIHNQITKKVCSICNSTDKICF